jgi:hypothetical protein
VSIDPGSANVFTRSGSTWTEDAKLIAADRLPLDAFGASVAISHDMIVVGAILDDLHGSAYVFEQDGGSWAQKAKLEPPDGFPVDQFGRSAAIGPHSTVVVGAHFHGGDPEPYPSGRGAAYVFDRQADVWSAPTMLTEPGSRIFGNSVGISGHTVMVGAGFTQVGENVEQGAVYVYKLRPPTPATSGDDHGRGAGKETGGASDGVNGHPLSASLLPETR